MIGSDRIRSSRARRSVPLMLAALGIVLSPAPNEAYGDVPYESPDSEVPSARMLPYTATVLDPDPGGRVVAAAIRIPMGSQHDPVGLEGMGHLLVRLLAGEANRRVSELGASVDAEVGRAHTVLTLVAPPDVWAEAFRTVEDAIYTAPVPGDRFDAIRDEALEILRFEAGAPVRTFELERARFVFGAADPAARPILGTLESLSLISLPDVSSFRDRNFVREEALLAVTGPVTSTELEAVTGTAVLVVVPLGEVVPSAAVATPRPSAGAPRPAQVPDLRLYRNDTPLSIPEMPSSPPAWSTGDRTVIDRELTSTWMAVSFPFPPGTPQLLLEFLGHLVVERLTPSPPDPGQYSAGVETLALDGAPVLVVTASVDPRVTTQWEDRLASSMDSLAISPPMGSFFDLARRRFRSKIVLERAVPENRARWLVDQIANGVDPIPDPPNDVWRIRREAVATAAAAAGPRRTILYGPVRMMDR